MSQVAFADFGLKVSKQQLRAFYQKRKMAVSRVNLREQAEAAKELLMADNDADTVCIAPFDKISS